MGGEAVCCVDPQLSARAQPVVDALRRAKLCVVTAESCTGGLIAAILSHGMQASDCLHGGYVVYTKAHKTAALGVDSALLDSQGSVNADVAREMVLGALRRSPANIAISVTGVLGPDPDEDGNPPGLVYFAVCRSDQAPLVVQRNYDASDPDSVRREVIIEALRMLQRSASE
ncbi:MAG: CinA domain protein [Gammaproteobacteria bacterium]|jgi:nicotinamide-nucleotide amidase|nr:CinA domain protein [Gammaproteobacteria bacterium]